MRTAIVGQDRVVKLLTIAIFARGHVLLEGDVGVGKTTLLRAASRALGGAFERVEGTIDLMPADLIYYTYLGEDGRPRVDPGPVLRHGSDLAVFFFNEINRARPQVHSLLLRLMAERSVTAFNREYDFPYLLVFADRNRIEREETFELPAAARDRFFMEITMEIPASRDIRRELAFDPRFHDADALVRTVPGRRARLPRDGRRRPRHPDASQGQRCARALHARPVAGGARSRLGRHRHRRRRHDAPGPGRGKPARHERIWCAPRASPPGSTGATWSCPKICAPCSSR